MLKIIQATKITKINQMSSTKIFKTITNFSSNKNKTISILNKAKTM